MICRELGIPEASIYNWKAKCSRMGVCDLQMLKTKEAEQSQDKKIVAEFSFENCAMKGLIEKKL